MRYWTELRWGDDDLSLCLLLRYRDSLGLWRTSAVRYRLTSPDPWDRVAEREYRSSVAVRELWKGIRAECPEAFADAVFLGWVMAPNDCSACHGQGMVTETIVDRFRQAAQWGCYDKIANVGLPTPMRDVRVPCKTCKGRRWV